MASKKLAGESQEQYQSSTFTTPSSINIPRISIPYQTLSGIVFPLSESTIQPSFVPPMFSSSINPPVVTQPTPPPLNLSGRIVVHPANYQLTNYNIYPPPEILFDAKIPRNAKIRASLVASSTNTELEDGFQYGELRTIRAGSDKAVLTGLKLNKMNKIKNELRKKGVNRVDRFHIRLRAEATRFDTSTFKLVSSGNQVPEEIRKHVRPGKKTRQGEEEQEQKNPDSDKEEKNIPIEQPMTTPPPPVPPTTTTTTTTSSNSNSLYQASIKFLLS